MQPPALGERGIGRTVDGRIALLVEILGPPGGKWVVLLCRVPPPISEPGKWIW
jgi:hypothetical protein